MSLYLPNSAKKPQEATHRLLACYECYTLEKLPPYKGATDSKGMYLEKDRPLEHLIETKHTTDGQPHRGMLFTCDEKTWTNLDSQVEISKELFKDQAESVAFRETLADDAIKCYNKHNRPKDGCIDYRDESKRLPNPGGKHEATAQYLCDYCVVTSGTVLPKIRKKLGLYK